MLGLRGYEAREVRELMRVPIWVKLVAGCWFVGGHVSGGVALLACVAWEGAVVINGLVRDYRKANDKPKA